MSVLGCQVTGVPALFAFCAKGGAYCEAGTNEWLLEVGDCLTVPGRKWPYSGYDVLRLRKEKTELVLVNDVWFWFWQESMRYLPGMAVIARATVPSLTHSACR